MRRRTWIVLAALGSILCATPASPKDKPFEVWVETDRFAPDTLVVASSAITIKDVKFFNPWFALFQAKYLYSKPTGAGTYIFDISYYGDDWMFWNDLTIRLSDTEVRRLDAVGTPRRDTRVGGVEEHVRFAVPEETMKQIAGMQQVDMRVNGRYYYDFYLTGIGTAGMKLLMAKVAQVAPQASQISGSAPTPSSSSAPKASAVPHYIEELRELAKLRDQGILTEAEFTAKKRQLLGVGESVAPGSATDQAAAVPVNDSNTKIVVTIEGSVATQTEKSTAMAWTLRMKSAGPKLADAEIQFLDASGAVVATSLQRNLQLVPGENSTFTGITDLSPSVAAKVVRLGVTVSAR